MASNGLGAVNNASNSFFIQNEYLKNGVFHEKYITKKAASNLLNKHSYDSYFRASISGHRLSLFLVLRMHKP